jgi:NTP pyrophosphatase (non-canonical NTP hydrolase)
MTFNEYQEQALTTAQYPICKVEDINSERPEIMVNRRAGWIYPLIGLTGEVGELSNKLQKVIRDKNGKLTEADIKDYEKELGDCLWFIAVLAHEFGIELNSVAETNIKKLADRKKRNVIEGNGDNR